MLQRPECIITTGELGADEEAGSRGGERCQKLQCKNGSILDAGREREELRMRGVCGVELDIAGGKETI
jgi:hypothetical protein